MFECNRHKPRFLRMTKCRSQANKRQNHPADVWRGGFDTLRRPNLCGGVVVRIHRSGVDHAHMPTFCSGYGYWRSCTTGHGATLVTYQRTFSWHCEKITSQTTGRRRRWCGRPRDGASVSTSGQSLQDRLLVTDTQLMLPILANLVKIVKTSCCACCRPRTRRQTNVPI